jgi:hypothetical protein
VGYLSAVVLGAAEHVGAGAVGRGELVHHHVRAEGHEAHQRGLGQQLDHLRQGRVCGDKGYACSSLCLEHADTTDPCGVARFQTTPAGLQGGSPCVRAGGGGVCGRTWA